MFLNVAISVDSSRITNSSCCNVSLSGFKLCLKVPFYCFQDLKQTLLSIGKRDWVKSFLSGLIFLSDAVTDFPCP